MEFDSNTKVSAGARNILANPDVAAVMGKFGDGCLKCYKLDIRRGGILTPTTLRMARSFVSEFGREGAEMVIDRLFGYKYGGRYNGRVIGVDIFSSKYRWLATRLLMEAADAEW